ncbi:nodulation protein NfeD [Rhizobiaceae bacterium n13]|uniref:Nodulation protein NfeD n=1 Tax=Ferirhizobium litorale TaxID=2927786 RepID=A0AAE3U1P7_9HYPH|nr:nodulation protein NfeD [Fererhizobium litorale]MDI7862037.1 nodulation protein NfeD [Fererhizobium litorale]MDI7922691.1 nodulation protein NfeD [Fererhizobium litorale]
MSRVLAILFWLVSVLVLGPAPVSGADRVAFLLQLNGAVSPATAEYVIRGLEEANEQAVSLVILQMDTPGGLDTSMRDIIRAILSSSVPVASFVAPSGARAASAGTYILYASHIAAMAPGTNLGAATPIAIGGGGLGGEEPKEGDKSGQSGEENGRPQLYPSDAQKAKVVNDAVAYLRGFAELRGRNADWAEKAVREAASLSSNAALDQKVIDFMATSPEELLQKAHGRVVRIGGKDVRLDTSGLAVREIAPDWRTRLLSVIADPNIALILMMIGIYGLIFEFLTPGAVIPGVVGGICLLLGLYALAMLPVSYAGLGLIALAVGLLVAEAHSPTFGVFALASAVAMALGATILFDSDTPGLTVSWPVLGGILAATLGFGLLVARLAFTARQHAVVTGAEEMIGIPGKVDSWSGNAGYVIAHGERWQATSAETLTTGEQVRVVGRDGLTLQVARPTA